MRAPGSTPCSCRYFISCRSSSASSVMRWMISSSPVCASSSGNSSGASVPRPGIGLPCGHVVGLPSACSRRASIFGVITCSTPWASSCDSCHGIFSRSVSRRSASAWRRTMFSAALAALGGEQDLLARAVLDQPVALHALQRRGHRRRGDVQALGEARRDDGIAIARQVVQDLQVVLDDRAWATCACRQPAVASRHASIRFSASIALRRDSACECASRLWMACPSGARPRAAGRAARSRSSAASCSCPLLSG